jgi:IS1 family transposase
MPWNSTMNSWLFPPRTDEVQFDEKWSFVYKKEKHCRLGHPDDDFRGDCWDHTALDPEHRLLVSLVIGRRTAEHTRLLVEDFKRRTGGRLMNLMSSDELPAYAEAIREVYGEQVQPQRTGRPGRPAAPFQRVPEDLVYATVHKVRQNNRVVRVEARLIFGTAAMLALALLCSLVSQKVNTFFVERHNGSDRHRNSRKVRKTYRFSKDWEVHESVTYFTMFSANFCCPVRTLRVEVEKNRYRQRTPAMAAGLTNHIWSISEWLCRPSAVQR